jgi:hypothetical protein
MAYSKSELNIDILMNHEECHLLHIVRRLLVIANVVPSSPILVTLLMDLLHSSKTLVLKRATWRNIPEDGFLHSHYRENLLVFDHI